MAELTNRVEIGGFPFDSQDGDRRYGAADWQDYFRRIVGNGVYPTPVGQFLVTVRDGMTLDVAAGSAFINGVSAACEAQEITLDYADPVLDRIDRVVLRLDDAARTVCIGVLRGTPSAAPVAQDPERSGECYDLVLCDVQVRAGIAALDATGLIDRRSDKTMCGFVSGAIGGGTDTLPAYVKNGVVYTAAENGGISTALTAEVEEFGNSLPDLTTLRIVPVTDCGVEPTLSVNDGTAYPICDSSGRPAGAGSLRAGVPVDLVYHANRYFFKSGGVKPQVICSLTPPDPQEGTVWIRTAHRPEQVVMTDEIDESISYEANETIPANDAGSQWLLTPGDGVLYGQYGDRRELLQMYDPATKVWTALRTDYASISQKYSCKPFLYENKIYYFSAIAEAFRQYDLTTKTMTALTGSPSSIQRGGMIGYHGAMLHCIGSGIYAYQPVTNTWSTLATSGWASDSSNIGFFRDGDTIRSTGASGGGFCWDGVSIKRTGDIRSYAMDMTGTGKLNPAMFPVESVRAGRLYTSDGSGHLTYYDIGSGNQGTVMRLNTTNTDGEWGMCSASPCFLGNKLYTGCKYTFTFHEKAFEPGSLVLLCRSGRNKVTVVDSTGCRVEGSLTAAYYKASENRLLEELVSYVCKDGEWVMATAPQHRIDL